MFLNTLHDNRNKELATDASAVIAMTEEEKRRLQELLSDVDTFEETVDEVIYWEKFPKLYISLGRFGEKLPNVGLNLYR